MPAMLDGCIKCGACVASCPVMSVDGRRKFSGPRQIAIELPRFGSRSSTGEEAFRCTTCGLCEEACPSKLPIPQAILGLRNGMENEGWRKMVKNIDEYRRAIPPHPQLKARCEKSNLVYFPGCVGSEGVPEVASSVLEILHALGIKVSIPPEWVCCGSPLEKLGERERAKRLIELNQARLGAAELVITSCPGCTLQLRKQGLETLHLTEYLYEEVAFKPLHAKGGKLKVALHRPCHLVRGVGPHAIEYAHSLLSSLPGVKVIETEDPWACCGGGGGVAALFPALSGTMAKRRIDNAKASGADLMIAPCPFCVVNLRKAGTLPVEDLPTFLRKRMK